MKGIVLAAVLATLPSIAAAQTQAQFDRIDQLASYTLQLSACPTLGYDVALEGSEFERAMRVDPALAGLEPAAAERLYFSALERRSRTFQIDLAASGARAKRDLSTLRAWFLDHARKCQVVAADPAFAGRVTPPPGFDPEAAATAAADKLLGVGGLASWQTPQIQARGDLLTVAAACRQYIGADRSDALFKQYGSTDDQRARAYFEGAFQQGLQDNLGFDATQCERAIKGFQAKAGP